MTPYSSRLQVQRYVFKVGARTVEMRIRPEAALYVLAPDAELTPELRSLRIRGKRRQCPSLREVRPPEQRCTPADTKR